MNAMFMIVKVKKTLKHYCMCFCHPPRLQIDCMRWIPLRVYTLKRPLSPARCPWISLTFAPHGSGG